MILDLVIELARVATAALESHVRTWQWRDALHNDVAGSSSGLVGMVYLEDLQGTAPRASSRGHVERRRASAWGRSVHKGRSMSGERPLKLIGALAADKCYHLRFDKACHLQ